MYIIRSYSLESITCDKNGALGCWDWNKKTIDVNIGDTNVSTKIVHSKNGSYVYKEKERRENVDTVVNKQYIFEIKRYYHINKTITQLKWTS